MPTTADAGADASGAIAPTADAPPLTLYPHAPRSLLPLLRAQLPHTLDIVGTILANTYAAEGNGADHDDGNTPSPTSVRTPPPLPPVYASFPPHDGAEVTPESLAAAGVGAHDWVVAVALPVPSEQVRVYHAIVSKPNATPDEVEAGARGVQGALRTMAETYSAQRVVGFTHEQWEDTVRAVAGGPRRTPTYTFLAPHNGFAHTPIDPPTGWEDEFVLDTGREGDKDYIFGLNHYRPREYYAARAAHITCLRPKEMRAGAESAPARPAVFVMTHGDGSLGALYTAPEYRRRGLAKVVLAAHLAKTEAAGIPSFCYVEEGNDASMALWEKLGWNRLPWVTTWVFEKSVQEDPAHGE